MVSEPILGRDDRTMIATLQAACKMGYWTAVIEGKTLDLQPLRDLSLWIDGVLGNTLGFRLYHITQTVVWFACGCVLHGILRVLGATPLLRVGLTCLFLFHPVSMASVAWVASRKHLLACLFLGIATGRVVRWESHADRCTLREAILVSTLYMFAMASQPLGICWPFWLGWFVYARSVPVTKRFVVLLGACLLPVALFTAWANDHYYAVAYPLKHGGAKYYDADLLSHFLALGRYFIQIVAPISLSTTPYLPRSSLNTVGLAAFVCFVLAVLLSPRARMRSVWIVLFVVSIAPVTLTMTNIFGSDTYALLPLMSLCCLLGDRAGFSTENVENRYGRVLKIAMAGTTAVYAAILLMHIDDWMDDARFWRASYREGPSADNMTHVAYYDLKEGLVDEALALAQQVYAVKPVQRNLALVLPEAIFRSPNPVLDVTRKLEMLSKLHMASPWPAYYTALLYVQQGDSVMAWNLVNRLLAHPEQFGDRQNEVMATAMQLCQRARGEGCENVANAQASDREGASPSLDSP